MPCRFEYRCKVCGAPASSTRRDALYCRKSSCSHKARRAAARCEEYTPAPDKPTTATLHTTLAESPDLLRQALKAKHPLTLLAPTSRPDPFPIGDGKSIWLIGCRLGAATQVAISELQESLREQQVGVLVCGSITKRLLAACRRRGIIPVTHEARWLTMPSTRRIQTPHTTRICEKRTVPSTTVMPSICQGGMVVATPSAKGADVGAKVDKESLLKQESLAWATNYDRCGRCPTSGDAQLVLYCGRCRHLFCERCMDQDKAGLWMCPRCARKAEKAPSVPSLWVEESIEKQTARAQAAAKESKGLVKVIRCKCGRGFNTVLRIGTVDCACGARFRLASAARIVATVGRSVSARQGRVDALCRPS